MNKNIDVINDNLWIVNFHHVKCGYIKELSILHEGTEEKFAVLSNDGKYLVNKALNYSLYIPFIKAIMSLYIGELGSKQGFCKVIRQIAASTSKMTDEQIIKFIWSDNSVTGNWTIYENICKWEVERRSVQKQFFKKHPVLALINKFRKGVKK
jgi:hypothetical protein